MAEDFTFEAQWPELEARLRKALAARRIPADSRDDVVQETGLRLFRNWDQVRPGSVWAFALTVALNIVRDDIRRVQKRDPAHFYEAVPDRDVEHEALVRLELRRVREAIDQLRDSQRAVLLAEVGGAPVAVGGAALKMTRMRARNRLRELVERASGFFVGTLARFRRALLPSDPAFAGSISAASEMGAALVVSAALAAGAVTVGGPPPAAAAERVAVVAEGRQPASAVGRAHARWEATYVPDAVERRSRLHEGDASPKAAVHRPDHGDGYATQPDEPIKTHESVSLGTEDGSPGPVHAEHSVVAHAGGEVVSAESEATTHESDCDPSDRTVCQDLGRPTAVVTVDGPTGQITVSSGPRR